MFNWMLSTTLALISACSVFLVLMTALYTIQIFWYHMMGRKKHGKIFFYASALCGTSCHEISHAIICPFFGHRIKEIVLFSPDGRGTLGYVLHSYNSLSIYQIIGNFFIGIAPAFGGCAIIALATYTILPTGKDVLDVLYGQYGGLSNVLLYVSKRIILSLIESAETAPLNFILWFYITASVSLFLSPSPADIKGGVVGFVFFLMVTFIVKAICDYYQFPIFPLVESYVTAISLLLIISIITSLFVVIVSFLIPAVFGFFYSLKNQVA